MVVVFWGQEVLWKYAFQKLKRATGISKKAEQLTNQNQDASP
jgi:hypothetical protein